MVFGEVTLPWEWKPENRIRSIIYPLYLSIPLRILKMLGLDSRYTVRNAYYCAHFVLVIIGDYYFFKTGCRMLGKTKTRICLYFYLTNKFYNMHIIHCFGNSVESIISLAIFYYFIGIGPQFNTEMVKFTMLIVLSFMMRCTSLIGWIPLVLYKIVKENSFKAFLISGFTVAIPLFSVFICMDSMYYGRFTFVPYNFIHKNIIEDISSTFGTEHLLYYIKHSLFYAFNMCSVIVMLALIHQAVVHHERDKFPFFLVWIFTYVSTYSMIPHKEDRFIIPSIPFIIYVLGEYMYYQIKIKGRVFQYAMLTFVVIELYIISAYYLLDNF